MEHKDEPEYTITIEYDDFLTRFDLDEILASIDHIIETKLLDYYGPDFQFFRQRYWYFAPYREGIESEFSYLGIKSVDAGSITLTVFVSGVVLGYVAKRFMKGVDQSLFAEELEHAGRMVGDLFGSVLARVNNWAERYVPKQRELGGRVTKITAQRKRRVDDNEKNKP